MMRSRSLAAFALGSLLLFAGCKQDIGERCEQPSDCASGWCAGDNMPIGMAGVVGKTCTPGRVTVTQDAGTSDTGTGDTRTTGDGAADRTEAADAHASETGDAASETHAETGEAGPDTPAQGATDASDGAPTEAGGETSASDGAVDLGAETAAGG